MKYIKAYEQFSKIEELESLEDRHQVTEEDGMQKIKLNNITSEIEKEYNPVLMTIKQCLQMYRNNDHAIKYQPFMNKLLIFYSLLFPKAYHREKQRLREKSRLNKEKVLNQQR